MKKIFILLLSMGLSVTIISCGTAKDSSAHTEKHTAKTSENGRDISSSVNHSEISFGYDFRNGNWGDSQRTIEDREGELLFTAGENPGDSDLLTGETEINGYQVFFFLLL